MPAIFPLLPVVAAALIAGDGRILVQQRALSRSMAGLWEFPGGKIETDETPEAALAREIEEELGVVLDSADMRPAAFASEKLGDRHLLLLLYTVRAWRGEPRALDASAIRWVTLNELAALDMPPADVPLVQALRKLLSARP